jgi:hypothetical protein
MNYTEKMLAKLKLYFNALLLFFYAFVIGFSLFKLVEYVFRRPVNTVVGFISFNLFIALTIITILVLAIYSASKELMPLGR